ncbi:MAG: hypothetical protein ACLU3I_05300 [Acutalibacteraceae bacterium]
MKDLRRRFERFCLKNRGKGIPNLMLVIAIGNLVVYALSRVDPSNIVYSYLCFSRSAILRGQVWRLFTYVFTYLNDTAGIYLFLAVVRRCSATISSARSSRATGGRSASICIISPGFC